MKLKLLSILIGFIPAVVMAAGALMQYEAPAIAEPEILKEPAISRLNSDPQHTHVIIDPGHAHTINSSQNSIVGSSEIVKDPTSNRAGGQGGGNKKAGLAPTIDSTK